MVVKIVTPDETIEHPSQAVTDTYITYRLAPLAEVKFPQFLIPSTCPEGTYTFTVFFGYEHATRGEIYSQYLRYNAEG